MKKYFCSKKIPYILVFMTAALLCLQFMSGFVPYNAAAGARNSLTVWYGNEKFRYYDELIMPTDHLVAEELHDNYVNASPQKKAAYVKQLVKKGISRKKALTAAYPELQRFFEGIAKRVYKDKTDSAISFYPDAENKFAVGREKAGRRADEKNFYARVYEAWQLAADADIILVTEEIPPSVTAEDNRRLTFMRGSFSTDYSRSGAARKNNIALAMKKINGTRLNEGETFSFNGTVGARTEKNGYKNAKIIVGGKYVDGVGGGVCQVSTTLYNAALLSGADIDEASSHSLPPSYVEPSFDAMVNSGSCDLKFTNNTGGPLFIRAVCDGQTALVEFYGKENPYKILRKSVITRRGETPEDEIILDTEGKYGSADDESGTLTRVRTGLAGFESEGYLIYYKNGVKQSVRRIRKDKYLPIRGILAKKP